MSSEPLAEHDIAEREAAAKVLQAQFRKYQSKREESGLNLSASARWHEAIKNQQFKAARRESYQDGQNDVQARWRRASLYTAGLVDGGPTSPVHHSPMSPQSTQSDSIPGQKTMDPRYWLEMVDQKHRYGANLKAYHAHWNENYHGNQNFFYWLDHGDGRELDLPDSPRQRLDSERIIYLTIEQRRNYLVNITADGKLAWGKDGRPVDTARGRHKDLGNGLGIVDATQEEFEAAKARGEIPSSDSDSSYSTDSSSMDRHAHHYATGATGQKNGLRAKFTNLGIMDNLLRKTLNANTWIFVADRRGDLYVGLKETGKFQHSSFLAGSHVLAAGLIKVNQGQLTSLSPLSGHYRAGSDQFKTFVNILAHEWGCDMSKVSISKSLFMIGALEKYGALAKKTGQVKTKFKRLFRPHHKDEQELAAEKDALGDQAAQVAAARAQEQQAWRESVRVNRIVRQAADAERERIKEIVGEGGKLPPTVRLPDLPHGNKRTEEMTDDERIERGAALIARASVRRRKTTTA